MDPSSKYFMAQKSMSLKILDDAISENEEISISSDMSIDKNGSDMKDEAEVGINPSKDGAYSNRYSMLKINILSFLKKLREVMLTSLLVHYFLTYLVDVAIYLQSLAFYTSNLRWFAVLINSLVLPVRILLYQFILYMFNNVYKSKNSLKETFVIPLMTMSCEHYVHNCIFFFMLRDFSELNWTIQFISIQLSEAIILFTCTNIYQNLLRCIMNIKFLRQSKISPDIDDDALAYMKNNTMTLQVEVDYHKKKSTVRLLRCIWIGKMMALMQTILFYLLYQVRNKAIFPLVISSLFMDEYLLLNDSLEESALKYVIIYNMYEFNQYNN